MKKLSGPLIVVRCLYPVVHFGAAAGSLATAAAYEINSKRQMNQLEDDYKNERISRREYESRKNRSRPDRLYINPIMRSGSLDLGSSRNLKRLLVVGPRDRISVQAFVVSEGHCHDEIRENSRPNQLWRWFYCSSDSDGCSEPDCSLADGNWPRPALSFSLVAFLTPRAIEAVWLWRQHRA
jgi:hypothetical protein